MDWGGELGGPSPNLALPAPTADYLALHPLTKEFIHRKKKSETDRRAPIHGVETVVIFFKREVIEVSTLVHDLKRERVNKSTLVHDFSM